MSSTTTTFTAWVTDKDASCTGAGQTLTYSMACKPTNLASLFSINKSTRKITMANTSDMKYVGEIVCTISGLGEDGRALTGGTGTAKYVVIPSACV